MLNHTRSVAKGVIGRLRIGFVENASFHIIPQATALLRSTRPSVHLELHEMISAEMPDALARKSIDVAVMRPLLDAQALESRLVLTEPYCVALAANHPLATLDQVPLRELCPLPFIIAGGPKAQYLKDQFRPAFSRLGFNLKVGQEVNQLPAIIALVASGLGYTMLPRSATGLTIPGVVYRPLADQEAPRAQLVVAWCEKAAPPLVDAFVRICTQLKIATASDEDAG
ncbi:hypothetical protein C5748_05560 [Phyllobacterium phragmitis]|uniref:LysR substrate-binding domain-containing protein n=2 Tax=Phyllobacterium phragmitis TaxID=2670329 RepID=A0A2S9IWQ0_9HYPH|nr:hypothetical protein C5748_05560 [Phyllobacterium phragmitis]